MKHVDIYTDGACKHNPGPGGWGAIIVYKQTEKELAGGEERTTNNRMELLGAISQAQQAFSMTNWYIAAALTLLSGTLAYFVSGRSPAIWPK